MNTRQIKRDPPPRQAFLKDVHNEIVTQLMDAGVEEVEVSESGLWLRIDWFGWEGYPPLAFFGLSEESPFTDRNFWLLVQRLAASGLTNEEAEKFLMSTGRLAGLTSIELEHRLGTEQSSETAEPIVRIVIASDWRDAYARGAEQVPLRATELFRELKGNFGTKASFPASLKSYIARLRTGELLLDVVKEKPASVPAGGERFSLSDALNSLRVGMTLDPVNYRHDPDATSASPLPVGYPILTLLRLWSEEYGPDAGFWGLINRVQSSGCSLAETNAVFAECNEVLLYACSNALRGPVKAVRDTLFDPPVLLIGDVEIGPAGDVLRDLEIFGPATLFPMALARMASGESRPTSPDESTLNAAA